MDEKNDATQHIEQDIELVSIEDLRTAFGGDDRATRPESESNLVNAPTTMCTGWR